MLSYLTKDHTNVLVDNTKPGQAHWGGGGPQGKHCFECVYWTPRTINSSGNSVFPKRDEFGRLVNRRCRKATQLFKTQMSGIQHGAAVPPDALACKYFAPAERVWPIVGGRKAPKESHDA